MRRRSTNRLLNKGDAEATFELDLAPMLALMVTLIPIMLLATSFVKVRVIKTVLPQAVKEAIKNDKEKLSKQVPTKNSKWDYEALHTALYEVKTKYPNKYTMNIFPHEKVPYDEIVKAIDQAREAKKSEETFSVLDKKTQKNIKTRVMFPEVSFSGLIGG